MDSQLLALEGLAKKRYERAQTGVFVALSQQDEATKALETANLNVDDYKVKLPGLVDDLYREIMGAKIDAPTISEILKKELKLTAKLTELKAEAAKCATTLDLAKAALARAYAALAEQERKRVALAELRADLNKKKAIEEARNLAKVMDEFAGYRFIKAQ